MLKKIKKMIPIFVLIIGLILFVSLGGQKYLTLSTIESNYSSLIDMTNNHIFISSLIFMLAYILVVAFSIPGATIMTLMSGFLFGLGLGSVIVVSSATIGACIVFVSVKTAFADTLKSKSKGSIEKMRAGFEKDAFNYLLFLRLVPVFPFFVINIAAGVLGVKIKDFAIGTLLGIIPGSTIYVWVGTGIGYAISQGEQVNLAIIFKPQILLPICALAILSIIPIILKKIKNK